MKKLLSIVLPLVLVASISCKKDSDPAPSKTTLISSKSWAITKVTIKDGSASTVDYTSTLIKSCQQDDRYHFAANGVYTFTVGTDDCDGDSTPESGTWAFSSNETVFTLTEDTDVQTFALTQLTGTTMVLTQTEQEDFDGDGNEETVVGTFTFTAK